MIHNFLDFINEATMGVGKFDLDYEISPSGKTKLSEVSKNSYKKNDKPIKLEFQIDENPNDKDEVLIIRPTTYEIDNLYDGDENHVIGNNKSVYNRDNSYFYKIITDDSSIKQKWAVVKQNSNCGLIVQFDKSGPSKRGHHLRENAFNIKMLEISEKKGNRIRIFDKDDVEITSKTHVELFKEYENYMKSKGIEKLIEGYCNTLINWIGEDKFKNLKCIRKNYKGLPIIKKAEYLIDEYKKIRNKSDFKDSESVIPENTEISKWSPSDIWLEFEEISDESLIRKITSLKGKLGEKDSIVLIHDLNEYLSDCIKHKTGIIGVSLKQTILNPRISVVDKESKWIKSYKSFDIKSNRKTSKINFDWKSIDKDGDQGTTSIDSRTFNKKEKSKIQLEVKGTKGAGYVSGKAGSMIDFLLKNDELGKKLLILKKNITKETDKSKIREFTKEYEKDIGYTFPKNSDLKDVWDKDLNGDDTKNSNENSRLQSIIFIDWLDGKGKKEKDKIISDIVSYARSESSWSAPHLLLT